MDLKTEVNGNAITFEGSVESINAALGQQDEQTAVLFTGLVMGLGYGDGRRVFIDLDGENRMDPRLARFTVQQGEHSEASSIELELLDDPQEVPHG